MLLYDVLVYETDWHGAHLGEHPSIEHAFGADSRFMKPFHSDNQTKLYDWIFVGQFLPHKRPLWLLRKPGRRLAVGSITGSVGRHIAQQLKAEGVKVLDQVPYAALASLIRASRTVYVPAGLDGGGERAVLEAVMCGVDIQVEKDNPKLLQLAEAVASSKLPFKWSHHYYAWKLQRVMTRMYCMGRGRSSISIQHPVQDTIVSGVFEVKPLFEHFQVGVDGSWCLHLNGVEQGCSFYVPYLFLRVLPASGLEISDTEATTVSRPCICESSTDQVECFVGAFNISLALKSNIYESVLRLSLPTTVRVRCCRTLADLAEQSRIEQLQATNTGVEVYDIVPTDYHTQGRPEDISGHQRRCCMKGEDIEEVVTKVNEQTSVSSIVIVGPSRQSSGVDTGPLEDRVESGTNKLATRDVIFADHPRKRVGSLLGIGNRSELCEVVDDSTEVDGSFIDPGEEPVELTIVAAVEHPPSGQRIAVHFHNVSSHSGSIGERPSIVFRLVQPGDELLFGSLFSFITPFHGG